MPIDPLIASDPIIRRLYVAAEIQEMLEGHGEQEGVWGETRAMMDNFVAGGLISVGHKTSDRMAPLSPAKNATVWEMRVTRPRPAIRILGQFAAKDLFIALVWARRVDLGAFHSREWKAIIRQCKTAWRQNFGSYPPLKGEKADDYLTHLIHR